MKKIISILLTVSILFLFSGCNNTDTVSTAYRQEMIIVTMPSSPKCKTTNSMPTINKVLNVFAEIEKEPIGEDVIGDGWDFLIKVTIDNEMFTYSVGDVFNDSDGRQYKVKNYDEIKEKLSKIYSDIAVEEVDYTQN